MKTKLLLAIFLLVCCGQTCLRADEYDNLRTSWQNYLMSTAGSASSVASTANGYLSSMNTNSSRTYLWSYYPLGSSSANLTSTFQQLQTMALAWSMTGSSLKGNAALAAAINSGLDFMCSNYYTATTSEYGNWYDWEIGSPQALNNTAALMYSSLTTTELNNYASAENHYSPGSSAATFGWMTGANTSDKALVAIICGILVKNGNQIASGQTNLYPVFSYVTTSDGFYVDNSFVFHNVIAYTGHYGLVLLGDIPKIVNLLNGSQWAIAATNLSNIYNWATNSFEPLIYHGAMMDMVRGRAVSWSYETESGDGSGALSAMGQIGEFAPASVGATLTNFINSPQIAPGQFHFGSMDRVVAQRSGFAFGISMSSTRIANYESINSGNLHGWHQGDGMTYLYIGNSENQFNSDFWPTVDPYHLPGITVETNVQSNSAGEASTSDQNWVGGAQVAKTYGVAGMSLHAWNTTLYAKKSWFMFDNEIVCLGAGITCAGPSGVHTVAENRRLGSTISESFVLNGASITPSVNWSSNLPSTTASWCGLSGTGGYYFPAGNSNLQATFTQNTGTWAAINSGDSTTSYTDNYLKLWYNHGLQPTNATYSYVILPNMTSTSVSNYASNPDIDILANTPNIQAAKKPTIGVVAANFWANGNSSVDLISVNNKSSVITWENANGISVGISDPTQTNTGSITVTLNRSAAGLLSADPGVTVVQLSPQIILSVNVNGSAGKSYQAAFSYTGPGVPLITSVYPDGSTLLQSTNVLGFDVTSAAGVAASNIIVTLNGVAANNLVLTGTPTNWTVGCPLAPNAVYTAVITVTDANGNITTVTKSFDTFSAGSYTWEAEDFDYSGGHFIDNPQIDAYSGLSATVNVDTHQVNFGGTDLYRPNGMDTEVNGDTVRPQYNGTGHSDYSIGYFSAGSWANYTRRYPAGNYYVYARLASGGSATTCTLSKVTGGWGTTSQSTTLLGTFNVPLTGWETYGYIPLVNPSGSLATVNFNGLTNTLQLQRPSGAGSDCNANFLMLVPVFAANATLAGSNVSISFPTQSGFNYQVLYKNNLGDVSWLPLGNAVAGNNSVQTVTDSPGVNTKFYCVEIQ